LIESPVSASGTKPGKTGGNGKRHQVVEKEVMTRDDQTELIYPGLGNNRGTTNRTIASKTNKEEER
jgi:hypothetical protein